uniref:Uncharacterized protein n=1 Tax=Nelumbo nucifera TaxID=4432 RepID=A0A822YJG6_NELNU|nr:TPA_asm: hypothetical protein HUJ06_004974 [Nelumbo nucifera]
MMTKEREDGKKKAKKAKSAERIKGGEKAAEPLCPAPALGASAGA